MVINLLVLVLLLGLTVMWATYGLFSALLHLLILIAAAALAFAFWEVFAYNVFMGFMPSYAWGVGLLVPFAAFLLVLRIATDRLVRGNLRVPRLADQLGGGAMGALSGVLTAGVLVIGLGYLPLPHDLAGYRPYEVRSDGKVYATESGGKLWLPVDQWTSDFFSRLSGGSFSTDTPLTSYLPDPAKQAAVFRLARFYDENNSVVARPDEVSVETTVRYEQDELPTLQSDVNDWLTSGRAGGDLLLVSVKFVKAASSTTFDGDNILRLPPPQVRLNVYIPGQGHELLAPIGFARRGEGGYAYYPIADNQIYASSKFPEQTIHFVFGVPKQARPYFLLLRNTRLSLGEKIENVDASVMAGMIGNVAVADESGSAPPPPPVSSGGGDGMVISTMPSSFATHRITRIQQTAALPESVSKNKAQFASGDSDSDAIQSGTGISEQGSGGRNNSWANVYVSSSLRPVRVQIEPISAQSFAGQAVDAAGNLQEIWMTDTMGNIFRPFAWVIKLADSRQQMNIQRDDLRTNQDLPINQLRSGETLYVYFRVPAGVTLDDYRIGQAAQDIGFRVE